MGQGNIVRFGHTPNGAQCYRCKPCGQTLTEMNDPLTNAISAIDATPADRQAHSASLDEVEQITQLHRKNLVWLAGYLAAHDELVITSELLTKLDAISTSTVGRILSRIRQDEPRLSRKVPNPSTAWRARFL